MPVNEGVPLAEGIGEAAAEDNGAPFNPFLNDAPLIIISPPPAPAPEPLPTLPPLYVAGPS